MFRVLYVNLWLTNVVTEKDSAQVFKKPQWFQKKNQTKSAGNKNETPQSGQCNN